MSCGSETICYWLLCINFSLKCKQLCPIIVGIYVEQRMRSHNKAINLVLFIIIDLLPPGHVIIDLLLSNPNYHGNLW